MKNYVIEVSNKVRNNAWVRSAYDWTAKRDCWSICKARRVVMERNKLESNRTPTLLWRVRRTDVDEVPN